MDSGLLGYTSILDRDYPVVMGVLLLTSLLLLLGNIISGYVLVALVDPRSEVRLIENIFDVYLTPSACHRDTPFVLSFRATFEPLCLFLSISFSEIPRTARNDNFDYHGST